MDGRERPSVVPVWVINIKQEDILPNLASHIAVDSRAYELRIANYSLNVNENIFLFNQVMCYVCVDDPNNILVDWDTNDAMRQRIFETLYPKEAAWKRLLEE